MTGPARAITAVVLTLNEARHLPACLDSLQWADEIVVLDSGSTDTTVAIARAAGARIAVHAFENYSRQRQHALEIVTTPWVFFVDADERVGPDLAREARRAVDWGDASGFRVPRMNVFWGHTMRGGGWWPDCQLRLLETARARFDPNRAVHEVAHVDGTIRDLELPLVHLNYDTVAEFRAKQEVYARLEAERRWAQGWPLRARQFALQPIREFLRRYVTLGGWRDGRTGLTVCALLAWYEFVALAHLRRRRSEGASNSSR